MPHPSSTQKWLSFRRLNGALHTAGDNHADSTGSKTIVMGLVALCIVISLCSINDVFFVKKMPQQAMIHAVFCIAAACMYILFKSMKCMVATVLSFSEDGYHGIGHSSSTFPSSSYSKKTKNDAVVPPDVDITISPKPDLDLNDDKSDSEVPDIDNWNEMLEEESDGLLNHRFETVPREVVVSSMYLGGVGAFLAIGPLCMWNTASTLGFTVSLFLIAICSNEHPPAQTVSLIATLGASVWIEASAVHDQATMWPHIMLAAASPWLLRASSGTNKGLHYHRLSPSQTLETSLPISVVLAILVLCW